MKLIRPHLVDEIESVATEYFGDRQFFGVTYGSYATGENSDSSDLDVFFATPDPTNVDRVELAKRMMRFHEKYALRLDEEVPFDNKLVVSYEDLEAASKLGGLQVEGDRITVPPIIKDPVFLSSLEVRYRLLFNAVTAPHFFLGKDGMMYERMRETAEEHLYMLAVKLACEEVATDVGKLLEGLLKGKNGEEGEMYLGYKRNSPTLAHLKQTIQTKIEAQMRDIA